jgi:integrase
LDIQALYSKLQADGLSARTVRYVHSTLSSSLKHAVKWRILPQNPAGFVDLPRQQRREMQALTPEQARAFLTAASKDRYGLLSAFAMATGMRPGEYLALTWEDIDFDAGTDKPYVLALPIVAVGTFER